MSDSIRINKNGSIRATGKAAQALFEAMAKPLEQVTTTTKRSEFEGHTEGPWIARTYHNSKGAVTAVKVWAKDEFHGNLVAAMSPDTPAAVQGVEAFANASLIAAAPRLLAERDRAVACLRELLEHPEWMGCPLGYTYDDFRSMFENTRALLAEIGGGE